MLGLDVTVDMTAMGALFFGADGCHHHIGSNTWSSRRGGVTLRVTTAA